MRYAIRNIRTNNIEYYNFSKQKDFMKYVNGLFISWYHVSDFAHYKESTKSVCWGSLFIKKKDFKKVRRGESVDFFEISYTKENCG